MSIFKLHAPFQPSGDQPKAIKELVQARPGRSTLMGVTGSGKTFTIVSGSSFILDTLVNKPEVTMMSRCSGSQDSFAATTDTDVTNVYIYKHSNLEFRGLGAGRSSDSIVTGSIYPPGQFAIRKPSRAKLSNEAPSPALTT